MFVSQQTGSTLNNFAWDRTLMPNLKVWTLYKIALAAVVLLGAACASSAAEQPLARHPTMVKSARSGDADAASCGPCAKSMRLPEGDRFEPLYSLTYGTDVPGLNRRPPSYNPPESARDKR